MCHFINKTTILGEKEMKTKPDLNEGKANNTSKYKTDVLQSSKGILEIEN